MLTIKPIYGTTCAPLRWFSRISEIFKRSGWSQCAVDPCFYRYSENDVLIGMAAIHVDDIMFGCNSKRWEIVEPVIQTFTHSGLTKLVTGSSVMYLGLDVCKRKDHFELSQSSFIEERLHTTDLADLRNGKGNPLETEKLLSVGRQMIGALLWILQTRVDVSHHICMLASSLHDSVKKGIVEFEKWVVKANKLMIKVKEQVITIKYYPLWARNVQNSMELASSLFLFAFSDASHGSLVNHGSMESNMLILGIPKTRDGTILCKGNFIESSSRKIIRTCRSSLSAETVSLYNTCDLALWLRVLIIEILLGKVYREIVDGSESYKLITPFGRAPLASQIIDELDLPRPLKPAEVKEMTNEALFHKNHALLALENLVKTLLLTDSANAYSSVLSGNPSCAEKQTRIGLGCVRDRSDVITLSFIDKDFNLADATTKERSNFKILHLFFEEGYFRIGFLGREEVGKRKKAKKTDLDP